MEQGRIGVATIYLGGGVCGALGASLLQPSLFLVGASAGVYALLTSHLAHLYLVSRSRVDLCRPETFPATFPSTEKVGETDQLSRRSPFTPLRQLNLIKSNKIRDANRYRKEATEKRERLGLRRGWGLKKHELLRD